MISVPPAPSWFSDRLLTYARQAEIELGERELDLLRLHAEWVFFWNRVTNLTAAKTWDELIVKHYLDSIIVARRWLPETGRMLDIGSGAGFPGIPIKIVSPGIEVVLCELRRKRASFLKSFISFARMKGVRVEQGSWQEVLSRMPSEFDIVTWRAIRMEVKDVLAIVNAGLKDGGAVVCWTTPSRVEQEIFKVRTLRKKTGSSGIDDIDVSACFYSLPGNIERAVLIFKKYDKLSE